MPSPNTMARRPTERRWNCLGASARLERDDFPSNRHPTLSFCLSMIFFGKPVSTFPDHALALPRQLQAAAFQRPRQHCMCEVESAALIRCHAAVEAVPLLTRDTRRYRNYFPSLILSAPEG